MKNIAFVQSYVIIWAGMSIYESIIESLTEGLIAVDRDLKITVFNQSAEKIAGISSSLAIGKPFNVIFQKDKWFCEIILKTINECKLFSEYEGSLFQKYGSPKNVSISTMPIFTSDGDLSGAGAILKDLSHIKTIEEDSARKGRLAIIGTFAASLAHEVKNPLGGIRGAAQLLSKRLKEKGDAEYTALIIRESDRLNKLLEDILDFSNPRRINPAPINIHKIIDDVISIQGHAVIEKGGSIIKEYDPSIPLIMGDNEQLTQVFLNIIKNSAEAIKQQGEIRVSTRFLTDFHLAEEGYRGGSMVEIQIKDTGFGISKENIEKIFTPFFTTKKKGSGLGLAISLKIIKEHNGFFRLASKEGKGTSVSVLLPTAK